LRRPEVSPSLWFYIYDQDILAARVYSPSWKSADNVPPGCSSLQWEIYSSCRRPLKASVAEMVENCLAAMERMGLAARSDVIFTHHKHLPFGNVVFDLGMEERRDAVRAWVEAQGIGLAGRFGEWAYLWSNQSFMSGRAAVERLHAAC
jgi:protoporphyrinogen oxidase